MCDFLHDYLFLSLLEPDGMSTEKETYIFFLSKESFLVFKQWRFRSSVELNLLCYLAGEIYLCMYLLTSLLK